MNNTAPKKLRAVCCVVVMLAILASITPISAIAASHGIYIAAATSHYRHPRTGVIEDSGGDGSYELGLSMTQSATYNQALVEVDSSGNTYVTVRLKLMDNIQNPHFMVDGARNGNFSDVSAKVMYEDFTNNTTDFRIKVPSENAVIRCDMYVVPMGRSVIFNITLSNLQSGCGDFITSITVDQTKAGASSSSQPASSGESNAQTQEPQVIEEEPSDEVAGSDEGIQEFDADGNKVEEKEKANSAVFWIVGGIVVLATAGGCVWYFCFFKKRKREGR